MKPWIAHLIRMIERFNDRLGSQFAAAITYFSFLALIPILLAAFGIAGLVLAGQPSVIEDLKAEVTKLISTTASEGGTAAQVSSIIDGAISSRTAAAWLGIAVALFTGIGWMGNLKQAVRAQWRPTWEQDEKLVENFFLGLVKDLVALVVLGTGILLSVVLTTVSSSATGLITSWLGVDDVGWLNAGLRIAPIAVAIVADTLIFYFLYRFLPLAHNRAPKRKLWRGAIFAAVFFELLKLLLVFLVSLFSKSATAAVFGSVIVLLIVINLVARMMLMVAAWIATSEPNDDDAESADRGPDVAILVQPRGLEGALPVVAAAVGAAGVGAGAGWWARKLGSKG
ncbi:inner membrane protein YhjD [Nakamurella antarctica]|uniref:Inner membrane protein YhjD n=1 Tax=Nakamurella antarctica TaxID=1902245 RepID=A0A3G8ZMW3_9ACTN|nr:YhjD/YihY/BrkB family envelope integrity protein [Nakamurella antarctica]AZI58593.1 inner membrane protein YhjD [Nakamurella antarctica]